MAWTAGERFFWGGMARRGKGAFPIGSLPAELLIRQLR